LEGPRFSPVHTLCDRILSAAREPPLQRGPTVVLAIISASKGRLVSRPAL